MLSTHFQRTGGRPSANPGDPVQMQANRKSLIRRDDVISSTATSTSVFRTVQVLTISSLVRRPHGRSPWANCVIQSQPRQLLQLSRDPLGLVSLSSNDRRRW